VKAQSIINSLANTPEQIQDRQFIVEEIKKLNLSAELSKIATSIASGNINSKNQDFLVEICCQLHQVYSDWSRIVLNAIKKHYKGGAGQASGRDFNKKRYILRLLTELFLKGIFQNYKDMFPCLNDIICIVPNQPEFLNAIMILTDYFKTYGELIFHIVSKERRIAIDNHYEVTIPAQDRYMFLNQKPLENIKNYLIE
jgi:hypothetical protein